MMWNHLRLSREHRCFRSERIARHRPAGRGRSLWIVTRLLLEVDAGMMMMMMMTPMMMTPMMIPTEHEKACQNAQLADVIFDQEGQRLRGGGLCSRGGDWRQQRDLKRNWKEG